MNPSRRQRALTGISQELLLMRETKGFIAGLLLRWFAAPDCRARPWASLASPAYLGRSARVRFPGQGDRAAEKGWFEAFRTFRPGRPANLTPHALLHPNLSTQLL